MNPDTDDRNIASTLPSESESVPKDNRFRNLIDQVRAGSEDAAWELVETYSSHIRAVARRRMIPRLRSYLDSEDFVQSVWKSLFRVGPLLRSVESAEELVALLARMSSNKVIDAGRRQYRAHKHAPTEHGLRGDEENAIPLATGTSDATPSQFAIARERWTRLIRWESDETKQMISLRMSGSTYEEIAAELGIHQRTVRRTLAKLIE